MEQILRICGGGGIRTLDTGFHPYNGLANRRLQPLGHPSFRMGDGYADDSPIPPTEAATNWQSQILAATAYSLFSRAPFYRPVDNMREGVNQENKKRER